MDGLTHTKQLLNIVCIVYFEESIYFFESTITVSTHKIYIHIIQIFFFKHNHCITTYICFYYYSWHRLTQIVPPKMLHEIVLASYGYLCKLYTKSIKLCISYMLYTKVDYIQWFTLLLETQAIL